MATENLSKRRKFIADGVFYAEISEFFERELALEGYSGCVIRKQTNSIQIIIYATSTQDVLGEKARRINELTAFIKKRFGLENISLYAAKVQNRGLCAVAQCESLKYKMQNNVMPRRAAYGVLRFVMDSGAKGCEVVISGKLRGARAKSQKYTDGFMIHSGQPAKDFVDTATRCMSTDQGVLGFKVKIMLPVPKSVLAGNERSDKLEGRPLPDMVTVREPKEENQFAEPVSIRRDIPTTEVNLPQQTQQPPQQQPPVEEQQPQQGAGVTAEVPVAQEW